MNAITRYLPLPQVSKALTDLQMGARAQMQAGSERLVQARTLYVLAAQLESFESGLQHSKLQLTEVVAKKIHLRFRLAALKPETDFNLQQAYNELHLYEMRLLAYLRKGGQALKNYHERLQDLRAQTELDNEERAVQAAELAKKIQWLQDERFALEKELLKFTETKQELKFTTPAELDSTKSNPWLGRIRSWLPA
ncbi:hypothetical protein SAMN02745130_02041 [Thiothrix eikelboomii]|uniref:Restart primosome assembly protein PriC n=1 Tax=Thiothrix eikelboomii TaxID=92487 RepID=A0A1T4WQI4_9GAMM|nr:hypothetical protein [Thiothrix eikelboomii]SKA79632.1 hypothetical protein SAMN02745130_02041 [Thiothrix eikelboomii]